MKTKGRGVLLAVAAGLAVSASANAQFVVGPGTGTFTDISATGTPFVFTNTGPDDGTSLFNSSVTNALVSNPAMYVVTNGYITNSATFNAYTNGTLPVAGLTFGLFPFWDDLYIDGPGTVVHKAVVEGGINVEVIQWNQVRLYDGGSGSQTGTFEVKIFGSGPVLAQYLYSDVGWTNFPAHSNGISATVGVQSSASTAAQYEFNAGGITNGMVLSVTADTSTGACCKNDGSCVPGITGAACIAQGGVWQGANSTCNCPQPGACCIPGGCTFTTQPNCALIAGSFQGVGVTCSTSTCPIQYYDDDGSCENSVGATNAGGAAYFQQYTIVAGAEKITRIEIAFGTNLSINGMPITVYLLSDPNGDGNPTDAQVITSVPGVISGAHDGTTFPFTPNWVIFDIPDTTLTVGQKFFVGFVVQNEPAGVFPCGLDQSTPIAAHSWFGYTAGTFDPNAFAGAIELTAAGLPGDWTIRADAAPAAAACYPNCDSSTSTPCLNVLDFSCFLNAFAAGQTYANCDNSTNIPVLNVLDFSCFLNSFAAGCSSC